MARIQNEQLPWPAGIEVAKSLLTCVPCREDVAVVWDGRQTLDWIDAALDRLEMFLARQESLGNDPRAAAANRTLIDDLQKQITGRLSKGIAKPSSRVNIQLERWNRVVDAINHLDPFSVLPSAPVRELRSVARGRTVYRSAIGCSSRRVRRRSDRSASGCSIAAGSTSVTALAISLIAIPLFRRLIRLDWGEWLNARTTIAWLILGLVWWMWLTPGVPGPGDHHDHNLAFHRPTPPGPQFGTGRRLTLNWLLNVNIPFTRLPGNHDQAQCQAVVSEPVQTLMGNHLDQ